MKTKEFVIPAGMGGITDFSYVKCGEYSVETISPEYVILVYIKEADTFGVKFDLKVSDNLENGLNVRNAIFALQHCGALDHSELQKEFTMNFIKTNIKWTHVI